MKILKVMAVVFMLLFVGAVAAQAQEVSVSGVDGKGQALIYPYYNITQPAGMDYLRLVNTADDQGVGVKVRLRRADNSDEVIDFYVCLSAKDEWSGWILPVVNAGAVVGGRVISADSPNNPVTPTFPNISGIIPFQFAQGANNVNLEGYIEVISAVAWGDTPGQRVVSTSEACKAYMEGGGGSMYPGNVLIGDMHLINADRDADSLFAYNATALRDFNDTAISGVSLENDSPPRLVDSKDGIDGVEAAFAKETAHIMHTDVFRQNGVATLYTGQTDFIVLFPTKKDLFAGESVQFKAKKWDNAEHSELLLSFPSPHVIPPRPFTKELNYVRIGADLGQTIFQNTDQVYWGNLELSLIDQLLLDYLQANYVNAGIITQADIDAIVPGYEHGYVDVTFLSGAYDPLGIRPMPAPQPRGAIVLKFEEITENGVVPRAWTHALEAQYQLPTE